MGSQFFAPLEGRVLAKTLMFYAIVTVMLQRIVATVSLVSIVLLSFMLTTTTPVTAGPFGLLVIFISAYLTFVGLISFFLFGMNRFLRMVSSNVTLPRPVGKMAFKRAYYFSTVLAAAPVMLIGLQSVLTVGFYEVGLVVLFEVIACVYVGRQTK